MAVVTRSSFATRDPEEALPVLEPLYSGLSLAARPEAFRFDIDAVHAGPIRTFRYRVVGPDVSGSGDGTGSLSVLHLLAGDVRMHAGRTDFDAARPLLIPRSVSAQWDDGHFGVVNLDLAEVERFARRLAGSDAFRLDFTGFHPITPELSQFWVATVRTLNRDLLREPGPMESPLVRAAAFEQLALAVLRVFPNSLMALRDAPDPAAAVPAAVRRATAYMDDHLAEPLTVADVAAAANLSTRGLSVAFRRHLDTTPSAYLRRARLAAAHGDLVHGASASSTVAVVARRWGFNNPGRFADAYREAFGTSPAATLRS